VPIGQYGVHAGVDEAVAAATEAQQRLVGLSLEDRESIVTRIKSIARQQAHAWGGMELEETRIGRLEHKIEKLLNLERVPGVEWLRTNATSGSHGLSLEEFAPFGVLGVITPVTHAIPTVAANAINMIAAGNALVCNPHPGGAHSVAHAVRSFNRAIAQRFQIEHLITMVAPPTRATAEAVFAHPGVALLVVTGGHGVAGAAMAARKRAIVAGPGNPPVVVDETADLANAAAAIVRGAGYDNNLLCIGEKQVFCVASVFDALMTQMRRVGGRVLTPVQIEVLTRRAFYRAEPGGALHVNRSYVGQDPAVLAQAAGIVVPPSTQLLVGETEFAHPFVQTEQMMPFVPFVRVKDVDEAIALAIRSEHGCHHTAVIHSRNLDTITRFGHAAGVTLFVVNGPSLAGLGLGGEGYLSYSIATPTGEGMTNPLTFTRYRRVVMKDSLRMI
jgi:aldehyde dehydrogenase